METESLKMIELKNNIKTIEKIIVTLNKKQIFDLQEREEYFFKNHPDIMERYPFLVSHLCNGGDKEMLNFMLENVVAIDKGVKTSDEADLLVGKKLVNSYVEK
jgi:hypothetical protein